MRSDESSSDVRRWFRKATEGLWPVARGSLTLRKGPCIRKHCSACASGKGHSSYALYGRHGRRRFSIYVPERMVPEVRKAIHNGRRLQEFISEAGARFARSLKRGDQVRPRRREERDIKRR